MVRRPRCTPLIVAGVGRQSDGPPYARNYLDGKRFGTPRWWNRVQLTGWTPPVPEKQGQGVTSYGACRLHLVCPDGAGGVCGRSSTPSVWRGPPWIGLAQPRNFFGRGRRLRAEEVCAKCKLMLRVGGTFQSTLRYRRSTDPEFFLPRLALIWEVAEKAGFAHSSLFGLFSESGWVVLVRVAGPPSSSAGSQPQSRKLITVYGVI
jgi:hypothetical protein